jgi:hypothetical protein
MTRNARTTVCLLAGIVVANACFAQEEQPKRAEPVPAPRLYKLEFVVKEVENDKVVNSRAYSLSLSANSRENASIRAGSRVPYATTSNPATTKQYTFYEIGVNIDCRDARELPAGQLTLNLTVDVSSIVATKESGGDAPPVVRNTRWSSPVMVPIKKPTTVFSSDDPAGNRRMQLEVTALPMI